MTTAASIVPAGNQLEGVRTKECGILKSQVLEFHGQEKQE